MRLSRGAPKHPSIVLLKQFIRPKILLKATLLFFFCQCSELIITGSPQGGRRKQTAESFHSAIAKRILELWETRCAQPIDISTILPEACDVLQRHLIMGFYRSFNHLRLLIYIC